MADRFDLPEWLAEGSLTDERLGRAQMQIDAIEDPDLHALAKVVRHCAVAVIAAIRQVGQH